jgi:hypothetical protein
MPLDHDESLDLAAARSVRLAGRDFYVAPLSLRQILAIADHVPKLSAVSADDISGERLTPLAEVLWHGLRRAHPRLTRDEFFDLPITIADLVAALPVVIEQAGGQRVASRPPRPPAPAAHTGEGGLETPASVLNSSTGARSSPPS